jgi:hypothetical protein
MNRIEQYLVVAATGCVLAVLGACTPDPSGRTLSADTSERICQLTGDKDWLTGAPTTSQSATLYGFLGTDLGYPVEHGDRLALFFGDSRFRRPDIPPKPGDLPVTGPESVRADDAIGWVTTRTPPTANRCLDLTIDHEPNDPRVAVSPVVGPPFIKQGLFNVPSGGVSTGGSLYGFFWTDHCLDENNTQTCPGSETLNKIGRGVIARYRDNDRKFVDPVPLPPDFVYATGVDASVLPGLPKDQRLGVYVFAVPIYRGSVPYLAYAPLGTLADPTNWKFFTGRGMNGQPSWTSYDVWVRRAKGAPPPGRPDLFETDGAGRCIGEFSVTWNQPLGVWLMLYNCGAPKAAQILARVAAAPWGPWSRPTLLLDPVIDNRACQLLWKAPGHGNGCDDRVDEWPGKEAGTIDGGLYAPFVMERYTARVRTFVPYRKRATVYWLLSTYNPYQVTVMTTLMTVDALPTSVSASTNRPLVNP